MLQQYKIMAFGKRLNCECKLCGDREEAFNPISECSKLAQKEYKTTHDWVGEMIHYKRLKFDYAIKWCIFKLKSVLEIETHKNSLGVTNRSPNPSQKTKLSID